MPAAGATWMTWLWKKVGQWGREFVRYMDTAYADIEQQLNGGAVWDSAVEDALKQAIADFNANWTN